MAYSGECGKVLGMVAVSWSLPALCFPLCQPLKSEGTLTPNSGNGILTPMS